MPIINFQSALAAAGRMFKSHRTLEAESNSRLTPIKEQLEEIFKKHELNNIKVVLCYVRGLWDSKFGIEGSYLKMQEEAYRKATEEADKLLRKNHIQINLIRVPFYKYESEVVEVSPQYIYSRSVKGAFLPEDDNWDKYID